jgi:hypothetical protein
MKLLLTSAGIKNTSIHNALIDLLGKPIVEASALCIPTARYGHPQGSPGGAWRFISGQSAQPMCELGWKSLGVLELTALPSIDKEHWISWVRAADALLVNAMAGAERWAATLQGPAYAIDDQTAIKVIDGTVQVVSKGHWKLFTL